MGGGQASTLKKPALRARNVWGCETSYLPAHASHARDQRGIHCLRSKDISSFLSASLSDHDTSCANINCVPCCHSEDRSHPTDNPDRPKRPPPPGRLPPNP